MINLQGSSFPLSSGKGHAHALRCERLTAQGILKDSCYETVGSLDFRHWQFIHANSLNRVTCEQGITGGPKDPYNYVLLVENRCRASRVSVHGAEGHTWKETQLIQNIRFRGEKLSLKEEVRTIVNVTAFDFEKNKDKHFKFHQLH